ncbi:hypothetical protein [Pedobacter frigidisoli]|uniref:hypothetical protein n=1 Tax=Pedobacter frigidisoli TaxID=2530455 RepID=UPI0013F14BEE|nr:hypothetical protein [Pedobacter frigidisoli]
MSEFPILKQPSINTTSLFIYSLWIAEDMKARPPFVTLATDEVAFEYATFRWMRDWI